MRCLPSFLFYFFWQHANLIDPLLKKTKLWRLPKTEGSILKYIVPPLRPAYIGEKRTPISKAYGIKVRWYGEHVGENIAKLGNILGTSREHSVKTLGSKEIWKKIPPPPPKHKRKKSKAPWVHAWALPLAAWNFSSQKTWLPFLAWANSPCKEQPTYSMLGHIWF